MTRRRWLAFIISTAIVAVGAIVTVTIYRATRPTCLDKLSDVAGAIGPAQGKLKVVESGLTQLHAKNAHAVSAGAIIENTSTEAAFQSDITFVARDAAGRATVPESGEVAMRVQIPLIMPGQRVPIGKWFPTGETAESVKLEVVMGQATWLTATESLAPIVTSLQPDMADGPHWTKVAYNVHSPYCQALAPRSLSVVYRDAAGSVVGGFWRSFSQAVEPRGFRCPAGQSQGDVYITDRPFTAESTKTQVQLFCDPTSEW